MKELILALLGVFLCLSATSLAKESPPKVQVYSHKPGHYGNPNTLICHVTGFHPPEITIQLFKNGVEITGANQTDLAFEANWHYHLTKHVPFTPAKGEVFTCKVTHMGNVKTYTWEADV